MHRQLKELNFLMMLPFYGCMVTVIDGAKNNGNGVIWKCAQLRDGSFEKNTDGTWNWVEVSEADPGFIQTINAVYGTDFDIRNFS